jgi:hypothetical protein
MRFRVEVICVNDEGTEQRHGVMEMERRELAMETLGLSLAEGKAILRGVQDFVASQQISEDLQRRCSCPNCGQRYHSKEAGTRTVETVFGPVAVSNPRWERCSGEREGPKSFRPTATWLTGRTVRRSVNCLYYRRSSFETVEAVEDARLGIASSSR